MSSRRVVAPLVTGSLVAGPPVTGDDRDPGLAAALLEDVLDLVAGMEQVEGAVLCPPSYAETVRSLAWPGTPVVPVAATATVAEALAALRAIDAGEAVVTCADAPDLPPLLVGKLFSALTSAAVAVCPGDGGGLVAVGSGLPVPGWLAACGVRLDDGDGLERLRAAAPARALHVGSGWHRVRTAADVERLDPGLEGWEATRAWLRSPGR